MKSYNLKMNLQLFADPSASLQNTTGTMTNEMKTFYEKRLIDQAEPRLVHDQFADYYPVPQNGGKTIEFRKYDSLPKADTPLTEGVTPNGQTLNVTTITSDLHQYGGWTPLTDVLQMTAIDNTIVETLSLIGSQAGRTLDTVTREKLAAGTNVMYQPTPSSTGETAVTSRAGLTAKNVLTVKEVFRVAAALKAANAKPINGDFVAIIHPYVAYDLMMEAGDQWIDIQKYQHPENIYNGEIGKIGGVRFVQTTEAKIWKGTADKCADGVAVFGTLFIAANAYGKTSVNGGGLETIVKQKGSGGTSDPLDQRSTIGWKAVKTAEILTEEYMIRVESGSSWNAAAQAN